VTNPERVVTFDWSKELGVDAPTAARLRGVAGTAVGARLLAAQVENDLRLTCTAMAAELGNKGPFASGPVACQAAVDALKTTRTKLGTAAKIAVHAHPAVCGEPIDTIKECAKKCSGDDKAPDAVCLGQTAGRCPGTCDGPCEIRAPGQCNGTCLGQCDSGFSGTCEGTCRGKCDGRALSAPGECKGKCEGSCDAVVKGDCKGRCSGGCQLHASACAGLCTGRCSVPVTDPKCLGTLKLSTSAECASFCELRAVQGMVCGAAQVDVRMGGTKDPQATAYAGTIERHLPMLLKIEQQLKGRTELLTKAKAAVADGTKSITASGGSALPALSPCLFNYDKATAEGVTGLLEAHRAVNEVVLVARSK
jgi:hypothetical protein